MHLPRLLLTTAYSQNRKSTLTASIINSLINRGRKVSYFACGTDYLAPRINSRLLDVYSRNLDTYFNDDNTIRYLLAKNCRNSDLAVMEGMHRFYNGIGGCSKSSAYDLSRVTGTPVILIVNANDFSITNLAMLKGLIDYKADNNIKGIIFNRTTKAVYNQWKDIIGKELGIELLGYIPELRDYMSSSMYILISDEQKQETRESIHGICEILEHCIDLNALIRIAETASDFEYTVPELPKLDGDKVRIGMSMDNAFRLFYGDNIDILIEMGAEFEYFSPLKDEKIPDNLDALILSGGHPEMYGEQLSRNVTMRESIKNALCDGMPCMAFGGGFMYLFDELSDYRNLNYKMVGYLDGKVYLADQSESLGYMELVSQKETVLGPVGTKIRGHAYHSYTCTDNGDAFLATIDGSDKPLSLVKVKGNLLGGFVHMFYYSNPQAAYQFLKKAKEYSLKRL